MVFSPYTHNIHKKTRCKDFTFSGKCGKRLIVWRYGTV
ncbi:hypothetical protein E2C01_069843 [Portunus trituberculatus]|uniref:Uncharacterized protein n=1 Tax=Portunus trituberculatus TaxID=210409 RepID=A0A5B7I008_PORTR|nr:hypothetical protein [Portunus trituberculatus]